MNRSIINGLRKNIATRGLPLNSWDVVLPHILFSLRMCKNKTVEFAPFEVIFSKPPELMSPLDFSKTLNIPPVTNEFIKEYMIKVAKI